MTSINMVLQPDADGSVHVPVPEELRKGAVRVCATMSAVAAEELAASIARPTAGAVGFGGLKGKIRLAPDFDAPMEDFRDYTG